MRRKVPNRTANLFHIPSYRLAFKISGLLILILLSCRQTAHSPEFSLPATVDYNYHVRPILSDHCFNCHGPDKEAREVELRLDLASGGLQKILESGSHAFLPGSPDKSEAFQRMNSADPDVQMPPPEFPVRLSEEEIAIIGRWIEQGAPYKPHWAFIPPSLPRIPRIENSSWVRNAIDYFVLKKLEENNILPNEEADREVLIRRLSFDLTGLPPSIAEIDAFLSDTLPGAYERLVDRLLDSPHFGERIALDWLDVARYADSNGYSQDGLRIMWPWRDWVIRAFNRNMPFDQFISWQIGGDKLPGPTPEQLLATAFLRNHRQNGEGGIVDEEYRIEYVADRTETTATAFLGLTMQCARCHDHKYDPVSQEEYYRFFSFFDGVNENGSTANDGNSGPEVLVTNREVEKTIAYLNRKIEKLEGKKIQLANQTPPAMYQTPGLQLKKGLCVNLTFDSAPGGKIINQADKQQAFPARGELILDEGTHDKALRFSGYDWVEVRNEKIEFDRADAFSLSFYLKPFHPTDYMSLLNHLGNKANNNPGYEVAILNGYLTFRLVHSLPANLIAVRTNKPLEKGVWTHIACTYDGSGKAQGIELFADGKKQTKVVLFDQLTQSIQNNRKVLKIGGKNDYQGEMEGHGFIDDLGIYNRKLSEIDVLAIYAKPDLPLPSFTDTQLKMHYLLNDEPEYNHIQLEIQKLHRKKFNVQDTLTGVMVMEDLPEKPPTYILNRGVYDAPTQAVEPSTPRAILPFPDYLPKDRAGLASWLVSSQNPLTARVIVNRFWQMIFGRGLVKTTEDFGNQGALPAQPLLLDWLSATFIASGWDTKALLRQIVMSATYRQSSRVNEQHRLEDPENIFLSRGPSQRLPAELLRDCVLAASGLLTNKIGGASVRPYQPPGLWEEKGEFSKLKKYDQDHGEDLYRRGLYTFWRRTSPLPSMTTFDAPNRDNCIVRRQQTLTPLQALVLFNDPQFVEAARVLASRVMVSQSDRKDQIALAYRMLTGLTPQNDLVSLLMDLQEGEQHKFDQHPAQACQLLGVGEFPVNEQLVPAELAAMTMVCSTIMSFDETLVKR